MPGLLAVQLDGHTNARPSVDECWSLREMSCTLDHLPQGLLQLAHLPPFALQAQIPAITIAKYFDSCLRLIIVMPPSCLSAPSLPRNAPFPDEYSFQTTSGIV